VVIVGSVLLVVTKKPKMAKFRVGL